MKDQLFYSIILNTMPASLFGKTGDFSADRGGLT